MAVEVIFFDKKSMSHDVSVLGGTRLSPSSRCWFGKLGGNADFQLGAYLTRKRLMRFIGIRAKTS